ncbi:MAG: peroxidase [Sphingomonadales bacterium]|nr:peroxidase [Sphingomonadales bacterium]
MTEICPMRSFAQPDVLSHPHSLLADIRAKGGVEVVTDPRGSPIYLVTSYALVEEVTKRTDDFSSKMGHLTVAPGSGNHEAGEILKDARGASGLLLISDDPEHKRYRALVNAVFAQGRVSHLTPVVEKIVDDLIDDMLKKGEADFVNEFAVLLPTYVIADILGLERHEWGQVRIWSDAVIRIVSRMGTAEEEVAAARMVIEFLAFIREKIRIRRETPADDLISNLINVRLDGMEPLTDDEATGLTFEIAVAGNETTRNTLMSGLAQLLRHPDQMHDLAADPSLVANAVEELLRYETPATSMWRIATNDTTLGGLAIPAGAEILLRYDGANRDPAKYENPDDFDIRRKNARTHVAFGAPGVHRCLGQMLARKEMTIALPRLLSRLHNIRVLETSDTTYWPGLLHRGIGSLHIAFDRAPEGALAAE